jgi:hypothetical protein
MSLDRARRLEPRLPGLFDELADARIPDYLDGAIERASPDLSVPRGRSLGGGFPWRS